MSATTSVFLGLLAGLCFMAVACLWPQLGPVMLGGFLAIIAAKGLRVMLS